MKKIIPYLVFISVGIHGHSQKNRYAVIDSIVRSHTADNRFSGVILLAENGRIKYDQAFGYRDFARQTLLQKTDVFELASVSKQFTAMVIMMLKEKGMLRFDDLLEKYVDIPYKGITIRHLLTHTSGLPDYQAVMDKHWDKSKVAGNPDIIEYLNTYAPPKLFEPGAKYSYSNTGYVMLASVAEKASGRDFVEFCKTEIFRKLGMKTAAIRTLQEKSAMPDFALGHLFVKDRGGYIRADSFPSSDYTIWLGNRKGPGRVSAAAPDLLKWDQALYSNKLVDPHTLEQAFVPMRLSDGSLHNYGFGWNIIPRENGKKMVVWHNGDNPGYRTQIRRYIDDKKTLIVLCNNGYDDLDEMIHDIVKTWNEN